MPINCQKPIKNWIKRRWISSPPPIFESLCSTSSNAPPPTGTHTPPPLREEAATPELSKLANLVGALVPLWLPVTMLGGLDMSRSHQEVQVKKKLELIFFTLVGSCIALQRIDICIFQPGDVGFHWLYINLNLFSHNEIR
jgi:hypothetical protein